MDALKADDNWDNLDFNQSIVNVFEKITFQSVGPAAVLPLMSGEGCVER